MDKYYDLYASNLEQVKPVGGDEIIALCPYNNDTNP